MRRQALCAPALALVLCSAATAQADSKIDANSVANGVQQVYDGVRSFQASFVQTYFARAYHKRKKSRGHLAIAKPGKMSFRYRDSANRVVSDGKTVQVYDAESKQLYVQSLAKSHYRALLAFLVGGGRLTQAFSLSVSDGARFGFARGWVLDGVPKQPMAGVSHALFFVDAETHQVRRVMLIDAQGNRNRFDFSAPRVNTRIPASEFRFHAPAGTRTVRP